MTKYWISGRLHADIVLGQCFSMGMTLFAKGHFIWLCLETFVVVTAGTVLLTSSRQRPGMLLNLQYPGQHPQQRLLSLTCEKCRG